MAKTRDLAAEKARKQKIMLAVGGVLLAIILAIQLPKLLSSGSKTPAAAPPTTTTDQSGGDLVSQASSVANNLTGSTGAVAVVAKPAGYVAGVALPSSARAKVSTGQLASFTLFETKDPFVQQVSEETAPTGSSSEEAGVQASSGSGDAGGSATPAPDNQAASAQPGVVSTPGVSSGSGSSPSSAGGQGGGAAQVEYGFATMMVNGNPEQLEKKSTFPGDDPVFVLVDVKKNAVQVGVAGGSLEGGKPATLKLGKKLTLVNTATGARWVLKLVYTGTEPETLETFSTGDASAAEATP